MGLGGHRGTDSVKRKGIKTDAFGRFGIAVFWVWGREAGMALEWLVVDSDAHTDYPVVQRGDSHVDPDAYSNYCYFDFLPIHRGGNDAGQGWVSRLVRVWMFGLEVSLGFLGRLRVGQVRRVAVLRRMWGI